MPKFPKPWFRKKRGWYVTLDGQQIPLGLEREGAFEQYHDLMRQPRERKVPAASVVSIIDQFLDWVQKNRAADRLVNLLLDLNDPTTRILLATAYFFRGDKLPILHDNHRELFYRYHVPFSDYWANLKYITHYRYDFVAYKGNVFPVADAILRQSQEPTIIYCPPEGHNLHFGKPKSQLTGRLIRSCEKHLHAALWKPGKPPTNNKVVVDLVSNDYRTEKIRFIAEHGSSVAAVLTVGMFKEGADWVEAARVIDLIPTSSDQDRNQRFGRIIRDAPGKECITYISLFPFAVDQDEETRRRHLSRIYAHFHASLVLDSALHPIRVQVNVRRRGKRSEDETADGPLDPLGELSQEVQENIISECYERLIVLQEQERLFGRSVAPQAARQAIMGVLTDHGVKKHMDPLARQIVLIMRRKANVQITTDELIAAGFDKVWSTDVFDGLIAYSAGFGGPSTLAEIRQIIGQVFERQWSENYAKVHALPVRPSSESSAYWWCTHNKVLHQQGYLDADKIRLLEAISWWSWTERVDDRWDQMYDRVKALPKQPKATTKEYGWVRQQRRLFLVGSLEPRKENLLETIPWWKWASLEANWTENYDALCKVSEPPPRGSNVYEWMHTQRKAYKDGRLSPDRAQLLESISWWKWIERASSREQGLKMLQDEIAAGLKRGRTKAEVRESWAIALGIGPDQIHKYLRLLPAKFTGMWARLGDARRYSA